MGDLRFRQVHLDFHNSEAIPGIGRNFSRKQFQQMLKIGHVNSITVFSKCHHGWAYHPSKVNEMHPGLTFDLLGEMIAAAHEIGVKTPVYISVGLDEKMARRHPEWLIRDEKEKTSWVPDFMTPGYHQFCLNSPYLDYVLKQIEEVVLNYDADGIFLDIARISKCYCQNCVKAVRELGKDPRDIRAMEELWECTYANYTRRVKDIVDRNKPGMRIFHNGGHIRKGRRDLAFMNTHLELESLPTGGWGYDHFPLSARYAGQLEMDFLGMTGKFHNSWGEFGGYKHPNALRYETALCLANGARCSVGDQMHPEGIMDEATYLLIGKAYAEVEEKEAYCKDCVNIADIGLLSAEEAGYFREKPAGRTIVHDAGAVRILLEGKYLFDVIDKQSDFNQYKVIILPDKIRITEDLKFKLEAFVENGGKILATGESGLNEEGNGFCIDFGVEWIGQNPYQPDYFRPGFPLNSLGSVSFVIYSQGQKIKLNGGNELGRRENPYFNRELFTFCSHQHSPSCNQSGGPGMVEGKSGIYIAWNVFEDYAAKGSLTVKEAVIYALNRLLPDKTIETGLPAQGIVTLTRQIQENRLVNHLLYASPVKRGNGIEVIEDILPLYNIPIKMKMKEKTVRVYLAPQLQELEFTQNGDELVYTVPKLDCHQMVVIDFMAVK